MRTKTTIAATAALVIMLVAAVPALAGAPVAQNDYADTTAGTPVLVDVLANDSDPDGDQLAIIGFIAPETGTVEDQGGKFLVTPNSGFVGEVSFRYAVTDPNSETAFADVFVTVTESELEPGSEAPVCTIEGTDGRDVLVGTRGDDVICGFGGNDILIGRGGNDILIGGDGNDLLIGNRRGQDIGDGGEGYDRAFFTDDNINIEWKHEARARGRLGRR